jgi:hypothetical protein
MAFYTGVDALTRLIPKLVEHLRHYKIAEGILNIFKCIFQNFGNYLSLRVYILGKLYQFFEDAEALLVRGKVVEIVQNSIENILPAILRKAGYNLLQHVVSLLVLG